jgi:formiminotetrahydrofolate cyclodeaminase
MVCRLTVGKKKYAEVEEEAKAALVRLEELRAELQRLVDADTEAYNTFGAALAMPKDTDEQKAARQAAMRAAARKSAEVPAQTLRVTAAIARIIRELYLKANRNCLPDSGTAMQMALAAARGAAYNVRTNLPGTGDESFAKEYGALADQLENEVATAAAAVHDEIRRLL